MSRTVHGEVVTHRLFARDALPAPPIVLRLDDGETLQLCEYLRVLAQRRVVARVRWRDHDALLKLFAHAEFAARELRGIERLQRAGIPAPRVLHVQEHALLFEWLPDARDFRAAWHASGEAAQRERLLAGALRLIRALHAAGLRQRDLHPGNLMCTADGRQWVIDGADIVPSGRWRRSARDTANLALLLSALPPGERALLDRLRHTDPELALPAPAVLGKAIAARDRQRARQRAAKALRACRQFALEQLPPGLLLVRRDRDNAALRAVLADPRAALATGEVLKAGNSATVARVSIAGRAVVIKHYHRGSRMPAWLWPTRARRAWQNCARLAGTGAGAPRALALIEERHWLRGGEAWLVYEHVAGRTLAEPLAEGAPGAGLEHAIRAFFVALRAIGCSHGDCKASNFIVDGASLRVVDLDAMRPHRCGWLRDRALAGDRARFLANFPEPQHSRLAALLADFAAAR